MIILKLHNLAITCLVVFYVVFLKKFCTLQCSRRNTVYFKLLARCVCCVWNSLVEVWGSEGATGGFVVCMCVCL